MPLNSTRGAGSAKGFGLTSGSSRAPYTANFLVVAGGGAGWHGEGHGGGAGGGGAGGLRTSYTGGSGGGASPEAALTFNPKTTYTITVSGASNESSIVGSDITTISSVGGGRGGGLYDPGGGDSGGSGGGGSRGTGGAGTANQGYPAQASVPGAGGGAGEPGGTDGGGYGGDGVSSSITGSAVFYAGGGSSGGNPGGDGGGGSSYAQAGTINSGGGGAAGNNAAPSPGGPGGPGPGGSGVVIIRVPTISYSGQATGSPTVTTDGTDTVIKFTGSGTYTG